MSLATRCTACGTVFRVVQDQLRVSSGWVRCGRCGEVFNAVESLVDLDVDRPEGGPPSVHGTRIMEELARVARVARVARPGGDSPAPAWPPAITADPVPGEAVDEVPSPAERHPRQAPATEATLERTREQSDLGPEPDRVPTPTAAAPVASEPASTIAPAFVRQADRAARWRHPGVRMLLGALTLCSAAALVWQVTRSHHDWLAARWPALTPFVQWACAQEAGCSIQPPRHLDGLSVESSGLLRAGGADTYRLTLTLRNRAAVRTRVPAIDLTLSDAGGRVVARRVLQPAELGWVDPGLAPGADRSASALLRVAGAQVVGYTIELFYP